MIVVSLTNCPPKLRGDLTKWLVEINTGVYVGKVSSRVRDELWMRICDNVRDGRATLVYSTNNEQGFDFRVHNTTWIPVDYDGIKLMLRPEKVKTEESEPVRLSREAQFQKVRNIHNARQKKAKEQGYFVIDIETTGLRVDQHGIIEIAALHIQDHKVCESFDILVQTERLITETITELTGIDAEKLEREGVPPEKALREFLDFVKDGRIVCHNAAFDIAFINAACREYGFPEFRNRYMDTLRMARSKLEDVSDYKLGTLAGYYGIENSGAHHALNDCQMTFGVFEKLNEIE